LIDFFEHFLLYYFINEDYKNDLTNAPHFASKIFGNKLIITGYLY